MQLNATFKQNYIIYLQRDLVLRVQFHRSQIDRIHKR